ncbi:MAG: hypothetical protein Kow0090_00460 [Myxococcota bacterium]
MRGGIKKFIAGCIPAVLAALFFSGCEKKSGGDVELDKVEKPHLVAWAKRAERARELLFKRRIKEYEEFLQYCESKALGEDDAAEYALLLASVGELGRAAQSVKSIKAEKLKTTSGLIALIKSYEILNSPQTACPLYSRLMRERDASDFLKAEIYWKRKENCPAPEPAELARDICGLAMPSSRSAFINAPLNDGAEILLALTDIERVKEDLAGPQGEFRCLPSSKNYIFALLEKERGNTLAALNYSEAALIAEPLFAAAAHLYLSLAKKQELDEPEKLLARLNRLIENDPTLGVLKRLIPLFIERGKAPAIKGFIVNKLKTAKDPFTREELESLLIGALTSEGDFNELFDVLEKIGEEKRFRQVDDLVGTVMITNRDRKTLEDALERRMDARSFTPPLIALRARLCEERGEKRCAFDNWLSAATQWGNYEPWQKRALTWLGRYNKVDSAIEVLERRARAEPINKEFRKDLIKALRAGERVSKLERYFESWEKDAKDNHDWLNWLGEVYLDAGEAKRASAVFKRALRLKPRNIRLRLNAARAFNLSGDDEEAMEIAKTALMEGEQKKPYATGELLEIHLAACERLNKRSKCDSELGKLASGDLLPPLIAEELRRIYKINQ